MSPYLLNEVDAGLQVHTEVDELPVDAFLLVLFLFQDEHVVVEELLEPLVGVVDTELLEAVELWQDEFWVLLLVSVYRSMYEYRGPYVFTKNMMMMMTGFI